MGTAKLRLLAGLRKIRLTPRENQKDLMQGSLCGLGNAGSRNLPHPHCHLPWSLTCLGVLLSAKPVGADCLYLCSLKPDPSANKQGGGWAQISRTLGGAGEEPESNSLGVVRGLWSPQAEGAPAWKKRGLLPCLGSQPHSMGAQPSSSWDFARTGLFTEGY